jgi:hypothetical protein
MKKLLSTLALIGVGLFGKVQEADAQYTTQYYPQPREVVSATTDPITESGFRPFRGFGCAVQFARQKGFEYATFGNNFAYFNNSLQIGAQLDLDDYWGIRASGGIINRTSILDYTQNINIVTYDNGGQIIDSHVRIDEYDGKETSRNPYSTIGLTYKRQKESKGSIRGSRYLFVSANYLALKDKRSFSDSPTTRHGAITEQGVGISLYFAENGAGFNLGASMQQTYFAEEGLKNMFKLNMNFMFGRKLDRSEIKDEYSAIRQRAYGIRV